jgi:hypothetical protein
VADWVTVSSLATAAGTLVLATATFASVRSANRAARAAERSMLAGIRPVLVPSRLQDAPEKIHFVDGHWVVVTGGGAVAEVGDSAIYLAMSLRNAGTGIAVLHGWSLAPGQLTGDTHPPPEDFRRLIRDLYVPAGEVGFWQGAFRDPDAAEYATARDAIEAGEPVTVDLLYGDHEGGQRAIGRFQIYRHDNGQLISSVSRQWNLDRPDPR